MKHRTARFMAGLTTGLPNPRRKAMSYIRHFIVNWFAGSKSRSVPLVRCGWDEIDPANFVPDTVRLVPEIKRDTVRIIRIDRDDAGKVA